MDTADKSIAGLLVTLMLGAGANYTRIGDKGPGFLLSIAGILQAVAAKKAAL